MTDLTAGTFITKPLRDGRPTVQIFSELADGPYNDYCLQ